MALSGSFTGSTNNQYVQPKITWSATQNIAENYSTVTATLTYSRTNSGYTTSGKWNGSITINGTTVTGSSGDNQIYITQNSNTKAMSATVKVPHNADGSKSVAISCTGTIPAASLQSTTCASTVTLNSIPRQATITSSPNFTDAVNPTITYSNPAGNAVAELMACISFTGANADIAYRSISKTGTSYTFPLTTAEKDFLRNNTTGRSRYVTFKVRTKIGSTYYESKDTPKTFTVTETDATKPTVNLTATLNNTSLPSKFNGLYIQGKSRLDINVSATGKYSASIISYSAKVGSTKYNLQSFTSNVLQESGKVEVIGYATDSRQSTGASAKKELTVIEYSKPLVIPIGSETAIQCYRSDGNGKRVSSSTSVWVKAGRSYYTVSGTNQCAFEWRNKLTKETWNDSTHKWKDLIPKSNTTAKAEYNALLLNEAFDTHESYSIQIRAIDDFGEYDRKDFEIPTEDVALHLGKGGKNVSIGTYCNYEVPYRFFVDWAGFFDKGLWGTSLNYNVTDVLTFAEESIAGLTPIVINDSTSRGNLPAGNYAYSVGIVHKRTEGQCNVYLTDYVSGKIAINVLLNGSWSGWKYITPQ